MELPPSNLLPLAESDGVVKIVFFALAAVVWLVVQVGSAVKSSAKKNAEKQRPSPQSVKPPQATRLERKLRERQQQAKEFRNPSVRVAAPAPTPPPQSYEEVRRGRQTPPAAPNLPVPARRPTPKPQPRPAVAPAFATTGRPAVSATEIGGSASPKGAAKRRAGRNAAISVLLRPGSLRSVIAAGEILAKPVALRQGDGL